MISTGKKILAIALAALMLASSPLAEAAPKDTDTEAAPDDVVDITKQSVYISELRLFKGKETAGADADGWTIVKNNENTLINLNEFTGKDGIYLGYKTTTDESKAIRSVKMLEMDHGYEWFDYQKIAEGQMNKIEPLAADLAMAAVEFKDNLSKGSRAAEKAKEFLNCLYFTRDYLTSKDGKLPDGDGSDRVYLGDYFASGDVDQQLIKKLLVRMNGGSLTAIYTQLALAVTDTDETWAGRIEKTESYKTKAPSSTQKKLWDTSYYEYAYDLLPKLQEFAAGYKASVSKKAATGSAVSADTSDVSESLTTDEIQSVINLSTEENAGDLVYEVAYKNLNQYSVGGKGLGDYIISLANGNYRSKTGYRALYPLVEAFTDGQFVMCKMTGIQQLALYLDPSDALFAEMDKQKQTIDNNIARVTGGDKAISVWVGVNTEFYERQVALTSDAYRESKAGALYTDLTREGEFYDNYNLVMMGIGIASSVCGLITGCIKLGLVIAASKAGVWAACAGAIGSGIWGSIGGVLGCVATVGGYVLLAAMIVAFIVYGIKWLVDYFSDYDKETYTTMPSEIYDIAQVKKDGVKVSEYIKYLPVTNGKGKPQDINADDGKRWNLLYYSKNPDLGAPLTVDRQETAFVRTTDTPTGPTGTVSVCCFGDDSGANLNSYVRKKGATGIYLHYLTTESIQDSTGVVDVPEEEVNEAKISDKGKFLYSLILSKESTESAAKAGIKRKKGYKVYDKNLTPGNGYTYIGYALTSVEKDAIRDIRVVPNYSQDVTYGGAGYTSAGVLEDGTAIVYTRYKQAGTPIVGGIEMSNKLLPPEDKREPVNMFCGGNAFNLNMQNRGTPMYLYFTPSSTYTSGEKYLAGIQFVISRKTKETGDANSLIRELGVTDYGVELVTYPLAPNKDSFSTSGYTVGNPYIKSVKYDDFSIRMTNTYTYNPYRAIYDIGLYVATNRITALQSMIGSKDGAYTSAESIMISDEICVDSNANIQHGNPINLEIDSQQPIGTKEKVKVLPSHSYINPPKAYKRGSTQKLNLEGNITVSGEHRLQGLYLLGPTENKKPLKLEDVVVSSSNDVPAGMHSVTLFTDPYREAPVNLAYNSDDKPGTTPVYMYIRGEQEKKPKYISSIEVTSASRPENTAQHTYSEEELVQYDSYADDTCRMGLISKASGGIYNYNLTVSQTDAWYNNNNSKVNRATYIGVNRTDDENKAITGLVLYRSDQTPPIRIRVEGVEYHRTGESISGYWMYYTKSPGANPGMPVTELSFDTNLIKKGTATVLPIASPDTDSGEKAKYLGSFDNLGCTIHVSAKTDDAIISKIELASSADQSSAILQLLEKGYNYLIDANLNRNAGGNYIYLAYKMTNADAANYTSESDEGFDPFAEPDGEDEDWSDFNIDFSGLDIETEDVIYDVIASVGGSGEESIMKNGVTYDRVSNISLNEGTGGSSIYMYATREKTLNIDGTEVKLSPLSALCVCSDDAVPSLDEKPNRFGKWEEFLDLNGNVTNLNSGVMTFNGDGYLSDCRLFLFGHRYDESVKPGAEIKRGFDSGTVMRGDAYLAG